MAKFLKSIFHTTDTRRSTSYEEEMQDEKATDSPPMDGRRQLSISRSGRMRQANKKRHSLTMELYGDRALTPDRPFDSDRAITVVGMLARHNTPHKCVSKTIHIDAVEKPKSVEYHVNNLVKKSTPVAFSICDINRLDEDSDIETIKPEVNTFQVNLDKKLQVLAVENGSKSPEEEIDNAFEIIDKS